MIMIRVDGNFYNVDHWKPKDINKLIFEHKIGGLIIFNGSVHGTYHKINSYQNISEIPLFIV